MNFKKVIRKINWYPPYIGAGIKVVDYSADMTRFVVEMKLRWYNKNLFGTHFGGSLYAMCDPFFVFIMTANLGKDYIVWDKAANINFVKPGKGKMTAIFEIPKGRIETIKAEVDQIGKQIITFQTTVKDEEGDVIAELDKQIYIRRKNFKQDA